MRLRLSFLPVEGVCVLPVHYNHLVQGFFYRHLSPELATSLHDEGFVEGRRHLKMFVFSRLMGNSVVRDGRIAFPDGFSLVVASPEVGFLESLALHLMDAGTLALGENRLRLASIEVAADEPYQCPVLLQALSPITVYSTLHRADGGRKTYYYSPFETEFSEQIVCNLQRKWRVLNGSEVSAEGAYVKPHRVNTRNQHIALYKGTVIKGWSGIYEAYLPEPLFRMALDAGLGSKNSQGFGCVSVYTPKRKEGE
ncbi:MAG: CRISPR-associated endoribonuclease Cas6 [Candidatus Caldarchaeum sp.]|nr:CRISPR-associated endoribonuclease Cas6 [Candidatus Caldarchaeum sp.]